MNTNRNVKQELKDLWNEHKGKVKVGAVCLFVGFAYGVTKGMGAQGRITANAMNNLIDKIPTLPEPDDIPIEEILAGCSKEEIMELMNWD